MSYFNPVTVYLDKRVLRLLFLGFSSGLPILLIFSTLSLWLKSAGIDRSTITFFSWAGLAYGFKFIWAPLIDRIPVPFLSKNFGHRKSWLLITQLIIMSLLVLISFTDPVKNILFLTLLIILLGFGSANQDIIIDAYRIESAPDNLQTALSAMYVIGYRIGMIVAGAGSLYFVFVLGGDENDYNSKPWQTAYLFMAVFQSVGLFTTLLSPEPKVEKNIIYNNNEKIRLLLIFFVGLGGFILTFVNFPSFHSENILSKGLYSFIKISLAIMCSLILFWITAKLKIISPNIVNDTFFLPFKQFTKKYGQFTIILILLIVCYRVADIVMGVVANLFYSDMGYNLKEIATYSKFWGLIATISGGVIGGIISFKIGVNFTLLIGAILAASSNFLFALISSMEPNSIILVSVITADNLSAGLASTAFVAFLGSLTNTKFTATQFAFFTSIMLVVPKLMSGYSGTLVDIFGYHNFFVITAIIGIPAIILNIILIRISNFNE